jgi:hypothetical protein
MIRLLLLCSISLSSYAQLSKIHLDKKEYNQGDESVVTVKVENIKDLISLSLVFQNQYNFSANSSMYLDRHFSKKVLFSNDIEMQIGDEVAAGSYALSFVHLVYKNGKTLNSTDHHVEFFVHKVRKEKIFDGPRKNLKP